VRLPESSDAADCRYTPGGGKERSPMKKILLLLVIVALGVLVAKQLGNDQ
jgi:hypothetical protein